MPEFDYTDVKLGARKDEAGGRLVIVALIDGVEVPVAVQKLGLYADQLAEAAKQRNAAEQPAPAQPATT